MYLKLEKIKEDTGNVWYSFCTDMAGEEYINERGIPRLRSVEVQGVAVFNKNTEDFAIDWGQTHDYFKDRRREPATMHYYLMQHNKNGSFPEIFSIHTGCGS